MRGGVPLNIRASVGSNGSGSPSRGAGRSSQAQSSGRTRGIGEEVRYMKFMPRMVPGTADGGGGISTPLDSSRNGSVGYPLSPMR